MKRCPRCRVAFEGATWRCPNCAWQALFVDDLPHCAPELAQSNSHFEPRAFAALAAIESSSFWFVERNRLIAWALEAFFPQASRICEVGCGNGNVTRVLRAARPAGRLTACEVYTGALGYVRERAGSDIELLQMDATRMPFSHEFDLVCAFDVIEHIDDDEAVLRNFAEALHPGGGLLLTVPQHPFLWGPRDVYAGHRRRYTRPQLLRRVQACGFEVMRITSFVSTLLPLMWLQVLASRGREPVAPSVEVLRPAAPVNAVLGWALRFERALIRAGVSLPFGGSLLLAARASTAARERDQGEP